MEKRDDVLLAAMTLGRKEATSLMSRDPAGLVLGPDPHGRARELDPRHERQPAVEALFNREPVGVGGGPATVNALAYGADGYTVTAGPTMRMLVDLADADGGSLGQPERRSGHPFGPYYADQAELWATNRTWPMVTTRNAVAAQTRHTWSSRPTDSGVPHERRVARMGTPRRRPGHHRRASGRTGRARAGPQ